MEKSKDTILLDEFELSIVKDEMSNRNMMFNESKNEYTMEELNSIGIVRESYSIEELHQKDFDTQGIITSFDDVAKMAEEKLVVGAPFAKGVKKWQLPIDLIGFKIITTVFPPKTTVLPHVHSVLDENVKSGGFRMVVSGSITFNGKKYLPGDWFFIPNGIPYSFTTDENIETRENYWYGHRHREGAVRISSPKAVNE